VRWLRVLTSVLMLTVTPAFGAATQTVVLDIQNMDVRAVSDHGE
jgi:hypothetical protein